MSHTLSFFCHICAQKADAEKAKQFLLLVASGILPNHNNDLQNQFLNQIGWHTSEKCKAAELSADADELQEMQAKIDAMATKAINMQKHALQENVKCGKIMEVTPGLLSQDFRMRRMEDQRSEDWNECSELFSE